MGFLPAPTLPEFESERNSVTGDRTHLLQCLSPAR